MIDMTTIQKADPELYAAMDAELKRQQGNIELIASENIVSPAVMAAAGSHLTNKYAEGLPGKRYYGGCEFVDVAENLARDRLKQIFGCDHCNVQPHSGAQANFAVYFAMLEPGDTIMGMNLSHGGHLTHGSPVNISGKYFKIVSYGVSPETETIDYDEMEKLALESKPKLIVSGASAYPRTIDFKRIREICDFVTTTTHKTLRGPRGGVIMCKEAYAKQIDKAVFPGTQGGPLMHIIAAKAAAFKEALSPEFKEYQKQILSNAQAMAARFIKNGIRLVSGGTDNHLMLLDLRETGVTGKELEFMLDRVHITVNKNTIPFETASPFVTSGIRVGTPAVTTRGMKEGECERIADLIARVIKEKESCFDEVNAEVAALCARFPIYGKDVL